MDESEEEDILKLLTPILNDNLSEEQINNLAIFLCQLGHLSKDGENKITGSKGTEKTYILLKEISKSSSKEWNYVLASNLAIIPDKQHLAKIVECSVGSDRNDNLVWILRCWNDLLSAEEDVKQAACMISNKPLTSKNWLVELCGHITLMEPDSELVSTLISVLQEKLSQSCSMSSASSFNILSSLRDDHITFAEEIQQFLAPFLNIFEECCTDCEIIELAKQLHHTHHLPMSALKAIESVDSSQEFDGKTANAFLHYLKTNAKEDWKQSLLNAIDSAGLTVLKNIIKRQMAQDTSLKFFIDNWSQLKQSKDMMMRVAKSQNLMQNIDETTTNWLLHIIHNTIISDEEAALTMLVSGIQELNKLDTDKNARDVVGDEERSNPAFSTDSSDDTRAKPAICPRVLCASPDRDESLRENNDKFAEEIQQCLAPFLIILEECLTDTEIIELTRQLHLTQNLPMNALEAIKSADSSREFDGRTASAFLHFLKTNAKEDWKQSLLNAIDSAGFTILCNIIRLQMMAQDTSLKFFIDNWSQLKQSKDMMMRVAKSQNLMQNIDETTTNWLLHIIHNAIISDEEAALTMLVSGIQEENKPSLVHDDVGDDERNSLTLSTDSSDDTRAKPAICPRVLCTSPDRDEDASTLEDASDFTESSENESNIALSSKLSDNAVESVLKLDTSLKYCEEIKSQKKYLVDFRVKICDENYDPPEGAQMFVHIIQQGKLFPMIYDANMDVHRLVVSLPVSKTVFMYKYFIKEKDNVDRWEKLPFYYEGQGYRNRHFNARYEELERGHVIRFDVVLIQTSANLYYEVYQKNFCKFLWIEFDMSMDETNSFWDWHKTIIGWIISASDGVTIYQSDSYQPYLISVDDYKEMLVRGYLNRSKSQLSGQKVTLQRIFYALAFVTALGKSMIRIQNVLLIRGLCEDLSVQDIKEENHSILVNQLRNIVYQWRFVHKLRNRSFEETFSAIFDEILKIHESLLVLPWLRMIQTITGSSSNQFQPKMPNNLKWSDKVQDMQKISDKSVIGKLAEAVFQLEGRFPWICKMYTEMLTIDDICYVLNCDHFDSTKSFNDILEEELVFQKTHDAVQKNKKRCEIFTVFNFMMKKVRHCSDNAQSNQKLAELAISRIQKWLQRSKELLLTVKELDKSKTEHGIETFNCICVLVNDVMDTAELLSKFQHGNKWKQIFEEIKILLLKICESYLKCNESLTFKEIIKIWNAFMLVQWKNSNLKDEWSLKCCNAIHCYLKKSFEQNSVDLFEFYTEKFGDTGPIPAVAQYVAETITKLVQENLSDSKSGWKEKFKKLSENARKLKEKIIKPELRNLTIKLLENNWCDIAKQPSERHPAKLLKFLGKCYFASILLQILCPKEVFERLDKNQKRIINDITGIVTNLVYSVTEGSVLIPHLQMMLEKRGTANALWECYEAALTLPEFGSITDRMCNSVEEWFRVVEYRTSELKVFFEVKKTIRYFADCMETHFKDDFEINVTDMHQILEAKIAALPLNAVIDCGTVDQTSNHFEKIKHFSLLKEDITTLIEIMQHEVLEKRIFQVKMQEVAKELPKKNITLHELLTQLWVPTKLKVVQFLQSLNDGSITLGTIEKVFAGSMTETDIDKMKNEFNQLRNFFKDIDLQYLNTRIEQIKNYIYFSQNIKCARILNKIRNTLKLEGDFYALDNALKFDEKNAADQTTEKCLLSFTDEVTTFVGIIGKISPNQLKVLSAFIEDANDENDENNGRKDLCIESANDEKNGTKDSSIEGANDEKNGTKHLLPLKVQLINWLKKMKNVDEMMVMSDLALTSAGENEDHINRVSVFNSAALRFSPFLFELPSDSGWNELYAVCKKVWKNFGVNLTEENTNLQALICNWDNTSKNLEWLKLVEESLTRDATAAVNRIQEINSRGLYEISGNFSTAFDLDDCLRLFVVQDNVKSSAVSLAEIRELNLRLIRNKKEEVNRSKIVQRFITTFNCVEDLAKVYVRLIEAGCILFNQWKAEVRCSNDDKKNHVTIQVYFVETTDETSESIPAISGCTNVVQELKNLKTALEDVYTMWINCINEKRSKYYHLNHFNIQQLNYLSKELAKKDPTTFPDQVYTLLTVVNEAVTRKDIVFAIDEATKRQEQEQEIGMTDTSETTNIQQKKILIQKLVSDEYDYTKNEAKAAVQAVSSLNIDECCTWLFDNQGDLDKIGKLRKEFDEEVEFAEKSGDISVFEDEVNNRLKLSLKELVENIRSTCSTKLHDREKNVGTAVKTVCMRYFQKTAITSLTDYISYDHLGALLAGLKQKSQDNKLAPRKFPSNFYDGKPNLILCSQADTWKNILSVYMHSPGLSLPSASEVLICDASTDAKEIELLLRRAIQSSEDSGNQIYCLACVDQLPFNVAKETEEIFRSLTQMSQTNEQYHLFVTTSDRHHYLTAYFDEFKADGKFTYDENSIKEYLQNHLCYRESFDENADKSVLVVESDTAGMGKSVFVKILSNKFANNVSANVSTIRFFEKSVDIDDVVDSLYDLGDRIVSNADPLFVHLDISPSVRKGVFKLLFDLVILGVVKNSLGKIWRSRTQHFYAIEYTIPSDMEKIPSFTSLLKLFPTITCLSPVQLNNHLQNQQILPSSLHQVALHQYLLNNEMYQRPWKYLMKYDEVPPYKEFESIEETIEYNEIPRFDFDSFEYEKENFKLSDTKNHSYASQCLTTLLKYCSIDCPSWSEISFFAKFLNEYLSECEKSTFCNIHVTGIESGLLGLRYFVVKFLIRMSQDFATSSLNIICANEKNTENADCNYLLQLHSLRRHWEMEFHPYLFFNADEDSLSFVHFKINKDGDLCHPKTSEIVEKNVIGKFLLAVLKSKAYRVNVWDDFDIIDRNEKLKRLCLILGVSNVFDPDETYELTTDNVLKMIAIHMRFKCEIPVVMMGETGCGKTRMIEFLCKMKTGGKNEIKNMYIVKVHGGLTVSAIQNKVRKAMDLARENQEHNVLETVLFLDEANTTEAIYAIKEVVSDGTVHGKPFVNSGLRIVIACNPYRKQPQHIIESMEKIGLGFHVKSEGVTEQFSGIPMRHLVYRVVPLPRSIQSLVWDFGRLHDDAEAIYIKQMLIKLKEAIAIDSGVNDFSDNVVDTICACLLASQQYMRNNRDVCNFVSLRDVERTIKCFQWFYKSLEFLRPLILQEKRKANQLVREIASISFQALIHALGMCYHATLSERVEYRKVISKQLMEVGNVNLTQEDILNEIVACQSVFIHAVELEKNVARNEALRENVFMIMMCFEIHIPIILVGKPGCSKSLAKTVVTKAMKGKFSTHDLFKRLKQIHVLSFQCSASTDASGIETFFTQCSILQEKGDFKEYVVTLVLDEIGLAEDSQKMPLKVLHSFLERPSANSLPSNDLFQNVGFLGISNCALDAAKNNRCIFVFRGEPSKKELTTTARAIFESDRSKLQRVSSVLDAITDAYLEIYREQKATSIHNQNREIFGLRDYYGAIKLMFAILSEKPNSELSDVATMAVLRNFSGFSGNVVETFRRHFQNVFANPLPLSVPVSQLICDNLTSVYQSRFLLLLTKQYSAVSLLYKVVQDANDFQIIFGSSFPQDHDDVALFRNINKIKDCMEKGRGVILLNLRDVYESLYEVLNQQFVVYGKQKYANVGLRGLRNKFKVAEKFRLIVIEEEDIVHQKFSVSLINRLEKYQFEVSSVLTPKQVDLAKQLKEWMRTFSTVEYGNFKNFSSSIENVFLGHNDDTPALAVLSTENTNDEDQCLVAQKALLQTCTFDGICRSLKSQFSGSEIFFEAYLQEQEHDSLWVKINQELEVHKNQISACEILTFSKMLTGKDREEIESSLHLQPNHVMLVTLEQFRTEQEYSERLDVFFDYKRLCNSSEGENNLGSSFVLLIQCSHTLSTDNLIACAKYLAMDKIKSFYKREPVLSCSVFVAFIITLERRVISNEHRSSYVSFYSPDCMSVYIDQLKPTKNRIVSVSHLWGLTISDILDKCLQNKENSILLNVYQLLKECIPDAMAKIKCYTDCPDRNLIKLLTRLCFNHNFFSTEISENLFFDILLEQVVFLTKDRETKLNQHHNWIIEESCSESALQEGGSFSHTLWLHLRKVVAVAIAQIISVVDVDNNLDLIINAKEQKNVLLKDLWLRMFKSDLLLNFSWHSTALNAEFLIKNESNFSCQYPFARLIIDYLRMRWMLFHERNVKNQKNFFKEKVITQLRSFFCVELKSQFIHDLVYLTYKSLLKDESLKEKEFEVIQNSLSALLKARTNSENDTDDLIELFTSYMEEQESLHLVAKIFSICPDIFTQQEPAERLTAWNKEQTASANFMLHHQAFNALLTNLRNDALKIKNFVSCVSWQLRVQKTKHVANVLVTNTSPSETKRLWQRIVLVEMFVSQLFLASESEEMKKKYVSALSSHALQLWRGSTKFDLFHVKVFDTVTKRLQFCLKTLELKLLCSWGPILCATCDNQFECPVLLPCGHYFCKKCAPIIEEGEYSCSNCRKKFTDTTALNPLELSSDQKKEIQVFQENCISFFLEYLSVFYFSSQSFPNTGKDFLKNCNIFEKYVICSKPQPLGGLEAHLSARSLILQHLLDFDADFVQNRLKEYLPNNEQQDMQVLTNIYIRCVRNCLKRRCFEYSDKNNQIVYFVKSILQDCITQLADTTTFSQVQHLKICANLQFIASFVTHSLVDIENNSIHFHSFLNEVVELFSNPQFSVMQNYVIKSLCRHHGVSVVNTLLEHSTYKRLVPPGLLPNDEGDHNFHQHLDFLVLFGETYVRTKSLLSNVKTQSAIESTYIDISEKLPGGLLEIVIALLVWRFQDGALHVVKILAYKNIIDKLQSELENVINLPLLEDVAAAAVKVYSMLDADSQPQNRFFEFIIHFGVTIICSPEKSILSEFAELIINPEQCSGKFWPSLPFPTHQQSYTLGNPINQTVASPQRRLKKLSVYVIRVYLHTAMLIGAKNGTGIQKILNIQGNYNEVVQFLFQHIQTDLSKLSNCLHRSVDETFLIMHQLLSNIRSSVATETQCDSNWQSDTALQRWEEDFQQKFLDAVFKDVDDIVDTAQRTLAKRYDDSLYRLVYELEPESDFPDGTVAWNSPNLWKYYGYPNLNHLKQILAVGDTTRGGAALRAIFDVENLDLVQHLDSTLSLQNIFVKRYRQQIDIDEAEDITIQQYLDEDNNYETHIEKVEVYLHVWNKLRHLLDADLQHDIKPHYNKEMDLGSSISMCLPNKRGRGVCALWMAEYLIEKQNNLLLRCRDLNEPHREFISIDVSAYKDSMKQYFIRINENQDLVPLLLANSHYGDYVNQPYRVSYNLRMLEKQVLEKFILNKAIIKKETILLMEYPEDMGFSKAFKTVQQSSQCKQMPLTQRMCQDIDTFSNNAMTPSICEVVRTLALVIQFLPKIGGKPETLIGEYAANELLLPPITSEFKSKLEKLSYILALYERLSWQKSKSMFKNGKNPFENVFALGEDIEDQEIISELTKELKAMNIDRLQLEINSLLMVGPRMDPDQRLDEALYQYLSEKYSDSRNIWCKKIPSQVLFKHAVHVFKLSMDRKFNKQNNQE